MLHRGDLLSNTSLLCSPRNILISFSAFQKVDSDSEPEDESSGDDDPRPAQRAVRGQRGQQPGSTDARAVRALAGLGSRHRKASSSRLRAAHSGGGGGDDDDTAGAEADAAIRAALEEDKAALLARAAALEAELKEERAQHKNEQRQRAAAEARASKSQSKEGELKARLEKANKELSKFPKGGLAAAGGRGKCGPTVGGIFEANGIPKTFENGAAIPKKVLEMRFSKVLNIPTGKRSSDLSTHLRELRRVASALLYHVSGDLNDDKAALFQLVVSSTQPRAAEKKEVADAAVKGSPMVRGVVESIQKKQEEGAPLKNVAQIMAPLTLQFSRGEAAGLGLEISEKQWTYANWHRLAWGAVSSAPEREIWSFRASQEKIQSALDHVVRNVQAMAFGTGKIVGPGGKEHEIPMFIREQIRTHLWEDHRDECLGAGVGYLGKSEYMKFMGKVAKDDPKALGALDPMMVRGKQAIEKLREVLLPELFELVAVDAEVQGDVLAALDSAVGSISGLEKHLKSAPDGDLSSCASHCAAHSLCDPGGKDKSRPPPCSHAHNGRCSTCESSRILRAKVGTLLSAFSSPPLTKQQTEVAGLVERELDVVDHWWHHEVRGSHEASNGSKILASLDDGTCFTTSDWKMKVSFLNEVLVTVFFK